MLSRLKQKKGSLLVVLLSLLAGILMGWLWWGASTPRSAGQDCTTDYEYVNPQPDCETLNVTVGRLQALQNNLTLYKSEKLRTGEAKRISIFVRDLKTYQVMGIQETDAFFPASLLKVPLMVAIFKFAELQPEILSREVTVQQTVNRDKLQSFPPAQPIEPGKNYRVEELIEALIVESDNNASAALSSLVQESFFRQVNLSLGISIPLEGGVDQNYISAKNFANIFRILYNSSYLSREYSNKALELLSQSTYADGIVAGVPKEMRVAHKFGERTIVYPDGTQTRELHDCGLVYAKHGPYSICVMTEGDDFSVLAGIIKEISRQTYESLEDN